MAISKVKLPDNTYQDIKDNVSPRVYIGSCLTQAGTSTKVVTVESFPVNSNGEPLVGTLIGVTFSYTNSASDVSLNVNGTGAKRIWYNNTLTTPGYLDYGGHLSRYTFYVWDGTYWVWVSSGIDEDENSIAYINKYYRGTKTSSGDFVRYRILFTSSNGENWVPSNTSTSTNATDARTVNQTPIDPFGQIVYYGSTTAVSANGSPDAASLCTQNTLTLGYSFNRTGSALVLTQKKPVYIKCAPQSDGSAIIDADTPYVQSLPSTADGKIYIYLGIAHSATSIEMSIVHNVYYYSDGSIRLWTNADASSSGASVQDVTVGGTSVVSSGIAVIPISTDVVSDKTSNVKLSSPKSVYEEIHPAVVTSQPAGGFAPNVLYRLGTLTGSVTFTIASPSDNTIVNHYYWTFTAGSTAPTITWPSGISWIGGSAPEISAGNYYEISILGGVAAYLVVEA